MPSRCAVLIWEAITILEVKSQARLVDVLQVDSRSAESELGNSRSRSRGDIDAAGITLSLSTPLDPNIHHPDLAKRRNGFLGGRRMKIKLRRLHGNERTVDVPMLLFARQSDSFAGDQPKCFSKRRWSVAQGLDALLIAGWVCWSLWCSSCVFWCFPAQPEWPSWLHSQRCKYQNADCVCSRIPIWKHCSMHLL